MQHAAIFSETSKSIIHEGRTAILHGQLLSSISVHYVKGSGVGRNENAALVGRCSH